MEDHVLNTVHVGALLDRAPGRKYVGALSFAEYAPRLPLPRAGTLASLRKELPEAFTLALRAPRSAVVSARGALRRDAELDAGVQWLTAAADALKPRVVVIATPSELTPGARSRDLLREYVAQLPRVEGRDYVWWAQGAWEPEEMHALCSELGIYRAFDPLETRASPGKVAYATLRALGHRSGFSLSALSDALVRTLEQHPEHAFVSVDAERGFDVARRLRTLADEAMGVAAQARDAGDEEDEELDEEGEEVEGEEVEDDDEDA
jgi:uncharacterized protein YecE (DUF72 family)